MKRGFSFNNIAQSSILTTILIVLLVLMSVIIVWNIVIPTVERTSKNVDINPFLFKGTFEYSMTFDARTGVAIVNRGNGEGEITKVRLVFRDANGQSFIKDFEDVPQPLTTKSYVIRSSDIGISDFSGIIEVSLYYLYPTERGEMLTNEIDSIQIRSGSVPVLNNCTNSWINSGCALSPCGRDKMKQIRSSGEIWCETEQCIDSVVCSVCNYTAWQNVGCGLGCPSSQMKQNRSIRYGNSSCNDVNKTNQCVADTKCSLMASMIAFYPFEGNANDVSGNNHNGAVTGAVLTTGKYGQGYSFDGIDDFIKTSDFDITQNFSVSFWFNATNITALQLLVYKSVNPNSVMLQFYRGNWAGWWPGLYQWYALAPGSSSGGILNGAGFEANKWYQVVLTGDSAGRFRIYINPYASNPVWDSQLTGFSRWNNGLGAFYIGGLSSAGSSFKGTIDDVQIYNRALTTQEVEYIYNNNLNA